MVTGFCPSRSAGKCLWITPGRCWPSSASSSSQHAQLLSAHPIHTSISSGTELGQLKTPGLRGFHRWNENKPWFARGSIASTAYVCCTDLLHFHPASICDGFYCNCTGSRKSAELPQCAQNPQIQSKISLCNPGILPSNSNWNTGMDVYKQLRQPTRPGWEFWKGYMRWSFWNCWLQHHAELTLKTFNSN